MFHLGTIWYLLHNLATQPGSDYINICLDNENNKLSHNVHGFDYRTCGITRAFEWNLKPSFVDILKSDPLMSRLRIEPKILESQLNRLNRMSNILNSLVPFGYDLEEDEIIVFWIFNGYEMNYDLADLTERTRMAYVVEFEPRTWLILEDYDDNQVGIRFRNASSTNQ